MLAPITHMDGVVSEAQNCGEVTDPEPRASTGADSLVGFTSLTPKPSDVDVTLTPLPPLASPVEQYLVAMSCSRWYPAIDKACKVDGFVVVSAATAEKVKTLLTRDSCPCSSGTVMRESGTWSRFAVLERRPCMSDVFAALPWGIAALTLETTLRKL